MSITGKSPNTDNKSSVSLIKLSAFPQSVFSLCLSNVRVHIFYLRKSINLLLLKKAHFRCSIQRAALSDPAICLPLPHRRKEQEMCLMGLWDGWEGNEALKCVCHSLRAEEYSMSCTWEPSALLNSYSVVEKN